MLSSQLFAIVIHASTNDVVKTTKEFFYANDLVLVGNGKKWRRSMTNAKKGIRKQGIKSKC